MATGGLLKSFTVLPGLHCHSEKPITSEAVMVPSSVHTKIAMFFVSESTVTSSTVCLANEVVRPMLAGVFSYDHEVANVGLVPSLAHVPTTSLVTASAVPTHFRIPILALAIVADVVLSWIPKDNFPLAI